MGKKGNDHLEFVRMGGQNLRRRPPFYRRTWFGVLTVLVLVVGVGVLAVMLAVVRPLREQAETFELDAVHKIERASIIFDRKGDEMGRIYVFNRTPVKIGLVPMHFVQALTAEEDSRFFQHSGVDYIGIIRAMWLNYKAGTETQGASTITQQLARDAFKLKELETGQKSSRYKRKLVEAFLAERIEKKFSKSEILELYLNRIYFGGGFYGVQAAAQGYFGKDVKNLDLLESATICGIIKSPNNLQPLRYPERSKKARNHVLDRMRDDGYITREEHNMLAAQPVVTSARAADSRLTYVYEEVRQEVMKIVGDEAAQLGGFKIYTTIDRNLQKAAEEAVSKRLAGMENRPGYAHQTYAQYRGLLLDYKKRISAKDKAASPPEPAPEPPRPQPEYLQAAVLMMDNHDGGILAMVGGRNYLDSMFNRAVQSRRPAGTAFLPFLYATAFQKPEYFPGLRIEDGPIDNRRVMIGGLTGILGEWGTEQDETTYADTITAREALLQSRNAATVRLGERIGLEPVKELAQKAGIKSTLRDYASTFLGASEVKLDEMCLAYSAFANGGKRPKEMRLVQRITDKDGKVIHQIAEDGDDDVTVMDEIAAYQTHTCLADALKRGTGKSAYEEYGLGSFPAAGKTGTNYEFKDLWFVGYTSAVTCGVWCGFDQQKTIYEGAYSNRIALPIWVDAMNATRKDYKAEEIPVPQDALLVEVCRKSGLRATDACYEKVPDPVHGGTRSVRDTAKEVLRRSSVFDQYCDRHSNADIPGGLAATRPEEIGVLPPEDLNPKLAGVEPVRMQGPVLFGDDPYNSVQPLLRALPVNSDGSAVKRALPVEEDKSAAPPVLKLKPPPPLKLEP
jgi:membrane carboxypeptidase/penicillin-binding protein